MKLLVSFSTIFLGLNLLFSNSNSEEQEEPDSSLYSEERALMEMNRKEALQEFLMSLTQIKEDPAGYIGRMAKFDPSLFSRATGADIHQRPLNLHWIEQIPGSYQIRLEDGSQWSCGIEDAQTVRSWRAQDDIEIARNTSLFTPHDYKFILINKSLNTSIIVNLASPPNPTSTYTHKIQRIEYDAGIIHLINGQTRQSRWEVHPRDKELIKSWKNQETLIIGIDVHWLWWLSNCDHILIHVKSGIPIHVRKI